MKVIKRMSLAEEVAELIRGKIRSSEYVIQSKLPTEPELMKAFGVGRSSVREAIRILVNCGYLRVQQGVGTFVISVDGNEPLDRAFERGQFSDLLEVRLLLETRIAEKAALNRRSVDLRKMRDALSLRKKYVEEDNLKACIEADIAFHQAVAEGCGNSILVELYGASSKYVYEAFCQMYTSTKVFAETQDAHEQLYLAIEKQNVGQTRKVLNAIIEAV
jgi:DNA-binding FadR family transcriptional regulator